MDDTRLQLVASLETASLAGPVSGWPHDFAAWVLPLWSSLRSARESRRVDRVKEATSGV